MAEAAAAATISAVARTAEPPLPDQTDPSPADRGSPTTTTQAPSSKPTTQPAPTTTPAAAPATSVAQPPAATPPEPMAQPAALSDPSAPSAAAQPAAQSLPAAEGHQQRGSVNKRKLETGELQNSTYFKIRAIIRDLRPAFLEVLQAPDFQNCKAADVIRRQVKVLLDLSKQLGAEAVPSGKKIIEEEPFVENHKEAVEIRLKIEKQVGADDPPASVPKQAGKALGVVEKVISEAKSLEKQLEGHQGTYVVGGSPMGWNFLVYRGSGPVYYGITKEAARSRRYAA